MATRLTGRDDGVYATVEDWYSTWQPPKCISSGDKEDPCSENRQNHHEVVTKSAESERQRGIRLWGAGNQAYLEGLYNVLADYRGDVSPRRLETRPSFRLLDLNIPHWCTW